MYIAPLKNNPELNAMDLKIDTPNFRIRLDNEVGYLKVIGYQNEESTMFFSNTIKDLLKQYPHQRFASLCDLQELILDKPKNARIVNLTIKEIADQIEFKYNAIVISPKFLKIVEAFIFSFYLNNANIKSKIFFNHKSAIEWLEKNGFQLDEIKSHLIDNHAI